MPVGFARAILFAVAVAAVVILSGFVLELRRAAQEQTLSDIRAEATVFTQSVRQTVSTAIDHVSSIGALFESSYLIDPREFSRFVIRSKFLEGPSRVRAIAVMPVLSRDELPSFQAELDRRETNRREAGYEPFTIEAEPNREIYAPVVYVESLEGREGIVGFDLASDPIRLSSARAAMLAFQPHLTPPVILSQDSDGDSPSVLIIGAVKSGGNMGLRNYKPSDEDRSVIIAASFTPSITVKWLVESRSLVPRFQLRISDTTDDAVEIVHQSEGFSDSEVRIATHDIVLGNRVWSFEYVSAAVGMAPVILDRFTVLGFIGAVAIAALALALDRLLRARVALEQIVRDRTEELRTVNVALAEAAQKAHAESDAKSMFLAHMSHELRTPLNAVIGYAQMLREQVFGPLGDKRYLDYARTIEDAGSIQLRHVEDILALTAAESGQGDENLRDLNLAEIVSRCADLVRGEAERAEVTIEIENTLGDAEFIGSERSVQQIVINLLSNAVKFTPVGGVVKVRTFDGPDGMLAVSVEDTGIGMSPDFIGKALQPFSQDRSDPYRSNEGVGLGLSIVKSLVDASSGEIEIESTMDKGTKVTVTLPDGRARTQSL